MLFINHENMHHIFMGFGFVVIAETRRSFKNGREDHIKNTRQCPKAVCYNILLKCHYNEIRICPF